MRKVIPPRDHSAPMRARTPERVPRDDDDRTERAAEKESFLRDVSLDNYGSSSSPSPSSSSSARANTPRPARAALAIPTDRETERKARQAVRWKDLPRKGQLTVLTLARLSEPLVQTSIQSYMFYQLKWMNPALPDSTIAGQAGLLSASFTAAQFVTAMLWGRVADSPRFGRKSVLLIGLCGTTISCLGFGFSTKFWHALLFRSIGGALNGNVGVLRTLISEIVREKKYQSRAFLLMPMTFNIGVIIGPILGGVLSDLAGSYPGVFGHIEFLRRFPYAAPNVLSAFFLFSAFMAIWLGLEETLDSRVDKRDRGIEARKTVSAFVGRLFGRHRAPSVAYEPLTSRDDHDDDDDGSAEVELSPVSGAAHSRSSSSSTSTSTLPPAAAADRRGARRARYTQRLPFRRLFTRNVSATLLTHFLLAFHIGTFNSLWFVFLSTPVFDPARPRPPAALPPNPPFVFTGGLGLPPRSVGLAMAVLGTLGIVLQLFLYPGLSARLGTARSWRLFLCCFPVAYFAAPFLARAPAASPPPHSKDGAVVWAALAAVLFVQVLGRTFALPAQTILVNNCTPHPSVLGTLHGVAQSVSSLARTVGPVLGGYLYGRGLERGVVGAVWWGLSIVAVVGFLMSWLVKEGSGHEIWLEGDVEEEKEEGEVRDRGKV